MGINTNERGAIVMSLPIIIGLAGLTITTAYYGYRIYQDHRPDPSDTTVVPENSNFYCALSANPTEGGEDWAVIYDNGRGHTKAWLRMVRSMGRDEKGEFDPYRRCSEIADRLNRYKRYGLKTFETRPDPATPNQYVLCARTKLSQDTCFLVLTMMPDDNIDETLYDVTNALQPGNPASLQSSGPITPENPKIISLEGQL